MAIAPDGRPYDIDNIHADKKPNEIEIIQYMRPTGERRKMIAEIDIETAKKADGLIISCEVLPTNEILIYARRKDQKTEQEKMNIAVNGPGANSPNNTLKLLINRAWKEA